MSSYPPGVIVRVVVMSASGGYCGNAEIDGNSGNAGRVGVPIIFPTAGVGPEYVVPAGWVTFPETVPPPITIFPFTSILPRRLALEPTESIVPETTGELDTAIMPVTVLLLARTIVPLLKTLPLMLAVPVDFTSLRLPIAPPLTEEELPIRTA